MSVETFSDNLLFEAMVDDRGDPFRHHRQDMPIPRFDLDGLWPPVDDDCPTVQFAPVTPALAALDNGERPPLVPPLAPLTKERPSR